MDFRNGSDNASETEFFIPTDFPVKKDLRKRVWPWILTTFFFATLCLVLALRIVFLPDQRQCPGIQDSGWTSDFPAARKVIETQQVQFVGNSAYDENGKFYIPNPPPIKYVGDPSPEIDQAWTNLTGERDFLISEEEAKEIWSNEYKVHWHEKKKGYLIGLDVFHTLHCLDNLRKFYYPEYYPIADKYAEAAVIHRGHCIDQIRQYVMCAGDMTPYGTRYFENPGRNYADSDVVHTCRNFDLLREWTRERYHAGGALHIPGVDIWDGWHE